MDDSSPPVFARHNGPVLPLGEEKHCHVGHGERGCTAGKGHIPGLPLGEEKHCRIGHGERGCTAGKGHIPGRKTIVAKNRRSPAQNGNEK